MYLAMVRGMAYGPFHTEAGAGAFAAVHAQRLSVQHDGEIIESNVQPIYSPLQGGDR